MDEGCADFKKRIRRLGQTDDTAKDPLLSSIHPTGKEAPPKNQKEYK